MLRLIPAPLLLSGLLAFGLAACGGAPKDGPRIAGADPHRGAGLIRHIGCGACHSIPGVPGADGRVGPPLDNIGARMIVAGVLPNTPANLIAWLRAPQSVVPGNAMPDMELSEHDARDVAAYLYTLR